MNLIYIITRILGIAGGAIAVYLFFENRRLIVFVVDEQLGLLDIKKEELLHNIKKEEQLINEKCAAQGIFDSGIRLQQLKEIEERKHRELRKIEIRQEYLLKIEKRKWPWSRIRK